eukprot:g8028.t1
MEETMSEFDNDLETMGHKTLYRYRDITVTELALAKIPHPTQPECFVNELREVRLRSIKSEQHTIIHFWNQSNIRVRVLWINFNGHEVAYSIINPGEKKRYRTFATHPWIVRNAKTRRRLTINTSEVIFGSEMPVEAIIREPLLLQWNVRYFPLAFKDSVRTFLLCHKHLRKELSESFGSLSLRNLGDLPAEIVKMIVVKMANECRVEQTLELGIHAAPNLTPVELPENVPVEEFMPLTSSDENEADSLDTDDSENLMDDIMEE